MRRIREMPPAVRARNLELLRETAREQGARIRQLLAEANREIRRAERRGCSKPVIDAVNELGERPVVKGMARSRHRTRIGDAAGTYPTRRLTPRHAVKLEDRYDGMSTFEATICADPPSVTGVQLQHLRMTKGVERERRKQNAAVNKTAKPRKTSHRSEKPGSRKP